MSDPRGPDDNFDHLFDAQGRFRDQRQGKRYDLSGSRITGLQLRVKPSSVRWSVRTRLHENQKRYDLGPAIRGNENIGGLSLPGARARAMRVCEMARKRARPCHLPVGHRRRGLDRDPTQDRS